MIKFPETAPNDPALLVELGNTLEDSHAKRGFPFYFLYRSDYTPDEDPCGMNAYPFAPEILLADPGVIYEDEVERYRLLDTSRAVDEETKWRQFLEAPQTAMKPLKRWEVGRYAYLSDPKSEIVPAGTQVNGHSPLLESEEQLVQSFLLNEHMQRQVGRVAELAIYWQTEVPDIYTVGVDGVIETFNIYDTGTVRKRPRQISDKELVTVISILEGDSTP